ncbi:hypothetical protein Dimus_006235 [Dionaea muscipula]
MIMATMGPRIVLIQLTTLILLSTKSTTTGLMSCNGVIGELTPCLDYITDKSSSPSDDCCQGVKYIVGSVRGAGDRKAICECIKSVVPNLPGYDPNRIPPLPKKCGLTINLPPIYANTDCSKW